MSFISESYRDESDAEYYSDSDYSGMEEFSVHEDMEWEDYANRSGRSGIDDYRLMPGDKTMKIQFKTGSKVYDYPFSEQYARLAKGGWGLNRQLNWDRYHGGYKK